MAITGLTDRASVQPRFPRLGKLRKGEKRTGRGPGKDLEYFRFTSDDQRVEAAFTSAYGAQPDRLEVYLPYKLADENFDTWMEEWTGGGMLHRCDGQICTIWQDDDGKYKHDPKPCPYASGKKTRTKTNPGCVEVGRLSVMLLDLLQAGHVGYVVMETHSNHDLRNIMAVLLAVEESRPEGLQGVPFTLRRYKDKISTPSGDNGGRARRDKWLVSLAPAPTWVESRMLLARDEAFARTLSAAGLLQNALEEGEVESSQGVEFDGAEECLEDIEAEFAELFPDPEPDPLPEHTLEWARTIDTGEPNHTPLGELSGDQLTWLIENAKGADVKRAAGLLLDEMQAIAENMPTTDPEPEPESVAEPVDAPSVKENMMDKFIAETGAEAKQLEM